MLSSKMFVITNVNAMFFEEVRDFVGGLLLRHICQLVCNAHAITDLQLSSLSGRVASEEQVRIATAIYPTASMMNHSCSPNISSTWVY